mgnify:FL=1|tara:strand:- start:904 stop:1455 length:552 start_codon:yes stop_codon:yes gene_type:complete
MGRNPVDDVSPKERERQLKYLDSVIKGETPEKRVMVGYESKTDKKNGDQIDELSEIMKEARMPWFCPECKKTMKKRLDDKMWRIYGHCFDCQVEAENKMRIEGTYEEWANGKVKNNTKAYLSDLEEDIKRFRNQKSPEFFNQNRPDGYSVDKEKWNISKKDKEVINKLADDALKDIEKMKENL